MNDLEAKLEQVLGNPQAMEQIMSLARSLGGASAPPSQREAPSPPSASPPAPGGAPDGSLENALGGLDPRILSGAAKLMTQYQGNDDERVALLNALRPFLKEQRYAKLDKAIQIAKLSRLIRMALEMFRAKGDDHV